MGAGCDGGGAVAVPTGEVHSSLAGVQQSATPMGITASLEQLLFQPSRPNVVVLVQDHYSESLAMLDHVFGTTHFTSSSVYRHNTAREGGGPGDGGGGVYGGEAAGDAPGGVPLVSVILHAPLWRNNAADIMNE